MRRPLGGRGPPCLALRTAATNFSNALLVSLRQGSSSDIFYVYVVPSAVDFPASQNFPTGVSQHPKWHFPWSSYLQHQPPSAHPSQPRTPRTPNPLSLSLSLLVCHSVSQPYFPSPSHTFPLIHTSPHPPHILPNTNITLQGISFQFITFCKQFHTQTRRTFSNSPTSALSYIPQFTNTHTYISHITFHHKTPFFIPFYNAEHHS